MQNKNISYLDLTGCTMPYDFFERVINALGLGDCGHNWDAIYDFGWSNSTTETVYITGEGTLASPICEYLPLLHETFDAIHEERQNLFGSSFTYIILS